MLEIPADLDPALIPLAFLLGSWEGEGLAEFAGMRPTLFRQRLVIEVIESQQVLRALSETWDAASGAPSDWECGFFRPGEGITDVEFVVAHGRGMVEVLYGQVRGLSLELATDAVMCTPSASAATASTRTYGRVEDDLAFAFYLATPTTPLSGHVGARLHPADALPPTTD